jgi:hypothetical protein
VPLYYKGETGDKTELNKANPRQTLENLSGVIICFLRCIYTFADSRGRLSLQGEIKLPYENLPFGGLFRLLSKFLKE